MRLLEEFWYGNIEPTEYYTNSCKEYKEVLRLITRNEEKLQAQLDEKNDQLLRMAAEYDNFRKRSQREKEGLYTDCRASCRKCK